MNPDEFTCWRCGANLKAVPLPYGRRAECPACRAELHVCRMCRHHAPGKAKQCLEPMAEEVRDKTRGNFCDWLQPSPSLGARPGSDANRDALASLFGEAPADKPPSGPDDLFSS